MRCRKLVWIGLACLGLVAGTLQADETAKKMAELLEKVKPSLVQVDFDLVSAMSRPQPQRVSGVAVNDKGLVLVPFSVLSWQIPDSKMRDLRVTVPGAEPTTISAKLLGRDAQRGVTLIQADKPLEVPAYRFEGPVAPVIGRQVVVVGLLQSGASYGGQVALSRVAAVVGGQPIHFLLTPAVLNGAGSIVFTLDGKPVGLLGAQPPLVTTVQGPRGPSQVRIDRQESFLATAVVGLDKAVADPQVVRRDQKGWLGIVNLRPVSDDDRPGLKIDGGNIGVEVADVFEDGPAAAHGVLSNDVIVAIDGETLPKASTPEAVREQIFDSMQNIKSGDKLQFSILRPNDSGGYDKKEITVVCGVKPLGPEEVDDYVSQELGLVVRDYTATDRYARRQQDIDKRITGVVVIVVAPNMPASQATPAGLQVNDLIIKIGDETKPAKISGAKEFQTELENALKAGKKRLRAVIYEGRTGLRKMLTIQLN